MNIIQLLLTGGSTQPMGKELSPMILQERSQHPQKEARLHTHQCPEEALLGGSWDLISTDMSTLIGVISSYKISCLSYNPSS